MTNYSLLHGDNLEIMDDMDSESIDLIYADPPFCTGKDWGAYDDRWKKNEVTRVHFDELENACKVAAEVVEVAGRAHSDALGAYLAYMGVCMLQMRRLLKKTGSIYLHCDQTASHYLKIMMDAIWGRNNFRNEIVWCYTGASNSPRWFPRKHDIIFSYSKTNKVVFERDNIRIPYHPETLARKGRADDSWFTNEQRNQDAVRDVLGDGKVPEDWWVDIPKLTNQRERVGYPTQKPLALLNRIIKASSNEGDIVLDPFCGSGTTIEAAVKLNRKAIGIDSSGHSIATTVNKLTLTNALNNSRLTIWQ